MVWKRSSARSVHNCQGAGIESRVLSVSRDSTPIIIRRGEARVYRSQQTLEIASCNVSLQAFSLYKRLASWADVIHYHFPWPFADLLHLTSRIKRPSILTYHSDIVRQRFLSKIYNPLMNRFLRSVDRIVCTSPNYFATSDVLANFESKVDVVPIGLDETTYPQVTESEIANLRNQYGEDFFLFVGVLRYYKGLHILLDAIKGAPYKVVITGSGPTEKELKAQAQRLNLSNVVFTGYVDDPTKVALFKLSRGDRVSLLSEGRGIWRDAAGRRDVRQAADLHRGWLRHQPREYRWRDGSGSHPRIRQSVASRVGSAPVTDQTWHA